MAGLPAVLYDVSESAKKPLIQRKDDVEDQKELLSMADLRRSDSRQPISSPTDDNHGTKCDTLPYTYEVSVHTSDIDAPSVSIAEYAADQEYAVIKRKCKDAALYVCEGEKDAKIFHHPTGYWSKRAFKIHHHPIYYVIHLVMSLLLMFLAPVESMLIHETNTTALLLQSSTELLLLSVFVVDVIIKFTWLGPKNFFKHKRTLLITFFLIVMILDVLVVLIQRKSHIRLTKALRPVFFIDSHYLFGVRRVMRQILLCAKPITDVLLLILFFIVFFSLLGYYFFTKSDPSYYATFWRTFVSLFITMTTANNPDVMLEVFYEHPVSVLFFLAYLVVTFYYLMNVLLAVVYGSYEEEEKKKFKKIFKHKIGALDRAYDILATEKGICFKDFLLFMHYFKPATPKWQVMCIFKALLKDTKQENKEQHEMYLSREQFFNLHDVRQLKWKLDRIQPYVQQRYALAVHKFCYIMVKSKPFNVIINLIVLFNLLFLLIYTIISSGSHRNPEENLQRILPVSYIFISIYMIEIILRIIGLGPLLYFSKKRNILDFSLILFSLICLLLETEARYVFLASVRPLKLIRVLRLKHRYRDITNTTIVLIPRLINVGLLLMVVYYFFAIIGMECLSGVVHKGCCNNSWYGIESSYSGVYESNTTDNFPASSDVYYILNFNNITNSYVTLFVLMVVNNWYIIMEGFASEVKAGWLVRVYFISFFIVMLVILQVVISFIVDEFKFKVLDTAKERICPMHGKTFEHCRCKRYRKKVVEITFLPSDVEDIEDFTLPKHRFDVSALIRKCRQIKLHREEQMKFIGRRLKTNDDVKLRIFQSEIEEWMKEYNDMKTQSPKQFSELDTSTDQKSSIDKAKSIARECALYFIDWVVE